MFVLFVSELVLRHSPPFFSSCLIMSQKEERKRKAMAKAQEQQQSQQPSMERSESVESAPQAASSTHPPTAVSHVKSQGKVHGASSIAFSSIGDAPLAEDASAASSLSHLFDDLLRRTLALGADTLVCFDSSALLELYTWKKDRRSHFFNAFFPAATQKQPADAQSAASSSSSSSSSSAPASASVSSPVYVCYYVMKEFLKNRPKVIRNSAQALRSYMLGGDQPPVGVRAGLGDLWNMVQAEGEKQAKEIEALNDSAKDDVLAFVLQAYQLKLDQPFTWKSECALRVYATEKLFPHRLGPGSDPKDAKEKDKERTLDDRAGDFIIWQKLLHVRKKSSTTCHLIWVSNDGKSDWWSGTDLTPYCRREFRLSNPQNTLSPYQLVQFEDVFVNGDSTARDTAVVEQVERTSSASSGQQSATLQSGAIAMTGASGPSINIFTGMTGATGATGTMPWPIEYRGHTVSGMSGAPFVTSSNAVTTDYRTMLSRQTLDFVPTSDESSEATPEASDEEGE